MQKTPSIRSHTAHSTVVQIYPHISLLYGASVCFRALASPISLLQLSPLLFFSPGATTPGGGCILQPSSGL